MSALLIADGGADANICDSCGWDEVAPDINPHRKKCPECGAPFFEREVNRRFMRGERDD